MLPPSAILLPPQGEAHGTVQPTFCMDAPAQAAPPQAGAGLSQERCWLFCPLMQEEVSTHAPHPPLTGVTEQDWLVYEPESTPLVHVRICEVQLLPQATDELW